MQNFGRIVDLAQTWTKYKWPSLECAGFLKLEAHIREVARIWH
jgi:hypothetical protein